MKQCVLCGALHSNDALICPLCEEELWEEDFYQENPDYVDPYTLPDGSEVWVR